MVKISILLFCTKIEVVSKITNCDLFFLTSNSVSIFSKLTFLTNTFGLFELIDLGIFVGCGRNNKVLEGLHKIIA